MPFDVDADALLLGLDPEAADPIDTIVVLELAQAIMTTRRLPARIDETGR